VAVLTFLTEVGDRGTAKMPITEFSVETREAALSGTTKKKHSLQQRTSEDGL
jgi:hypothetical protein